MSLYVGSFPICHPVNCACATRAEVVPAIQCIASLELARRVGRGLGTRPVLNKLATNMTVELETLEAFLPDLITAICNDVQRITDQCLSSGLISDPRRRRILELRSSEDQARELIQCVQNGTKTDNRCFEIFMDNLDKELPHFVKEKLLSDIRKELEDRARSNVVVCKALSPAESQPKTTRLVLQGDHQECIQQQRSLFGRYENSVKMYAHASAEKTQCKETLQNKTKESEKLRVELKGLQSQSSEANEAKEIESAKERLSACEVEISGLRERIEKLEGVIQEEDMLARRGKSIIMVGTKMFARMTEHALKEKEEECKRLLKEKEDELQKQIQEERDRQKKVIQAQQEEDEWELGKTPLLKIALTVNVEVIVNSCKF